jgi:hypothetical protein
VLAGCEPEQLDECDDRRGCRRSHGDPAILCAPRTQADDGRAKKQDDERQ